MADYLESLRLGAYFSGLGRHSRARPRPRYFSFFDDGARATTQQQPRGFLSLMPQYHDAAGFSPDKHAPPAIMVTRYYSARRLHESIRRALGYDESTLLFIRRYRRRKRLPLARTWMRELTAYKSDREIFLAYRDCSTMPRRHALPFD